MPAVVCKKDITHKCIMKRINNEGLVRLIKPEQMNPWVTGSQALTIFPLMFLHTDNCLVLQQKFMTSNVCVWCIESFWSLVV